MWRDIDSSRRSEPVQCQIRGFEGSGGDGNSKGVSKLLILIILPAGSSPSLSIIKINGMEDVRWFAVPR